MRGKLEMRGDHQQPVRPQMDGRRERSNQANATVAVPVVPDLNGRKEQGQGGRRHDVLDVEPCIDPFPQRPFPVLDRLPLHESHRFARVVIEGRESGSRQLARGDVLSDAA